MPTIFIALLLASALGTGLAAASTYALPGDPLYAFKTDVGERIAGIAAFTPEAQTHMRIAELQTRLQEITVLAQKGTLTQNTVTQANTAVRADITALLAQIHTYETKNNAAQSQVLTNDLEGVLGQQLVDLTNNHNTTVQTMLIPLVATVRGALDTLASN